MDRALIDQIARAVLYEGYVLYPYRPSSLKNTKRWTFGILYPEKWAAAQTGSDRSNFRMECLLRGDESSRLSALVRFLQVTEPGGAATEREVSLEVTLTEIMVAESRQEFRSDPIQGEIAFSAVGVAPGLYRLTMSVANTAESDAPEHDRDAVLPRSLISAHAALSVSDGEFVSLTDPPADLVDAASQCANAGVWPVLVGAEGSTDTILASPIILSDYPQMAPESSGDLYDATEIEEILLLRIMTLTDDEKAEVRGSEERARKILERAETLPAEHLMRLHGTIRGLAPAGAEPWSAWDTTANAPPSTVRVNGSDLKAGDRVRLKPGKRADIFDSALQGRVAVIEAIERDFEDNVHLAVVLEDDPGRDMGEMRQIGHRFFFSPAEVEPMNSQGAAL